MTGFIKHFRHNVVAYLALFVALGGTSVAAIGLPSGSVGTRQLRKGAVTGSNLAGGSVGASKLDPKSIAGYVAFWAQIDASGRLVASQPRATVLTYAPLHGIDRVNWNRVIPRHCFGTATSTTTQLNGGAYATVALANSPKTPARANYAFVQTYSGSGQNVPEPVNVVVICPSRG
jgi:hypothetical protein